MNNVHTLDNNYNLSVKKANYLINLSTKHKYLYSETPKVACSTVKKTLQKIEVRGTGCELGIVHKKNESPLLSPSDLHDGEFEKVLTNEEYFKFSFVRNPFSRILSAYLDKIVINEWEKKRHYPKLGFDLNDEVEFIDFLKRIMVMPPVDMDIHFCPQSTLIGYNRVQLDFIGKFENMTYDFNNVLYKISKLNNIEIEPIEDVRNHQVGANKKIEQYYEDGHIIDIVRKKYKDDFENFFYYDDPMFV